MSTVAPSNIPHPISRRSVAERRSASICHAALRTMDGSICSRVWDLASSSRCCSPFESPMGAGSEPMSAGWARCRRSGSRQLSSSGLRLLRLRCSHGSRSHGSGCDPSLPGTPWRGVSSGWNVPILLRDASERISSAKGMRAVSLVKPQGSRGTFRLVLVGVITKEVRTVKRMVAQKMTRVVS